MKHISTLLIALALSAGAMHAYTERDILSSGLTEKELAGLLVRNQEWVKYPDYSDRAGWDRIFGDSKDHYIKRGEKLLNYSWPRVQATDYLEYERSGNRTGMENKLNANNNAMADLLLAELAEGKGRFTDQLINGVYSAAEMTTWALSAHTPVQKSTRSIQAYDWPVIDLVAADMGNLYGWTYHFMKPEFDKVDPEISRRLKHELKSRILDPYLNVQTWWWDPRQNYKGTQLNNWSPWCLSNILLTSMLVEEDADRYARTAWLTLQGTDRFLNSIKGDGACDEGPSYWPQAAGKTLDYIDLLSQATGGKVNPGNAKMLRDMGEYIARSSVGDGWMVDFADASARADVDPFLVYRYGKAVDSDLMKTFAATRNDGRHPNNGRDVFRTLSALSIAPELGKTGTKVKQPSLTWYPETEVCYLTTPKGLFLAAKGGNNGESHNHNDVGSFALWVDNYPVFIDAGIGTYTRQTFDKNRYGIWNMQSGWHNLPVANGSEQQNGTSFKATNAKASEGHFEADIAGAYPKEAGVKEWVRSYDTKGRTVTVTDRFRLEKATAPNTVNFLTHGETDLSRAGEVAITVKGHHAVLKYDPAQFDATVEEKELDDKRLSSVWGPKLRRISLTSRTTPLQGTYTYTLTAQ